MTSPLDFKPLKDQILVERLAPITVSKGGIIIADSAQEKPAEGEVIAIGSKVTETSVGDRILFGKYSGAEITLQGKKYIVMPIKDVLGVLSE